MHCVLAVDGGNTKTIALVAGLDGTIVGAGRSGCTDIYNATGDDGESNPAQIALVNFEEAVMTAMQAAEVEPADLEAGVLNMAGADWPEDMAFWQAAATARGWGRRIIAQNDALGVLYAGS